MVRKKDAALDVPIADVWETEGRFLGSDVRKRCGVVLSVTEALAVRQSPKASSVGVLVGPAMRVVSL